MLALKGRDEINQMTAAIAKVCTECQVPKLLNEFGLEQLGLFGRKSKCRVCRMVLKKKKQPEYTAREAKRRHKGKILLTQDQIQDIIGIYERAAELRRQGLDVAVDHIDPINGVLVCGLTTPTNLQILTKVDNLAKSNSFKPYRITFNPDGTTTETILD